MWVMTGVALTRSVAGGLGGGRAAHWTNAVRVKSITDARLLDVVRMFRVNSLP